MNTWKAFQIISQRFDYPEPMLIFPCAISNSNTLLGVKAFPDIKILRWSREFCWSCDNELSQTKIVRADNQLVLFIACYRYFNCTELILLNTRIRLWELYPNWPNIKMQWLILQLYSIMFLVYFFSLEVLRNSFSCCHKL